jgi:hypothetical protein
MTVGNEGG